MKNKILKSIASAAAILDAGWMRLTQPKTIVLANASPAPKAEDDSAKALQRREADEKEIRKMVAAGLSRNQAEAALRHKKEFAKRDAAEVKRLEERASAKK